MASHTCNSSSSSFSSSSCWRRYDVFLSFRGPDTRKKITGHLYEALYKQRIHTFFDDEEIKTGDEIKPALITAIEQSKISIPVFSKNYATSKCCLQELTAMFKCHEKNGQVILPIFFDIKPSHVSNQTGSFENCLAQHEKDVKPEIVDVWREALRKVGDMKGEELENVEGE